MNTLPDIYWFDPTCELSIATDNPNITPTAPIKKLIENVETLSFLLAQEKDSVLVKEQPPVQWKEKMRQAGFSLPAFVTWKETQSNSFVIMPKGWAKPWGHSPATYKKIAPFLRSFSNDFSSSPVGAWQPQHKNMYSRALAAKIATSVWQYLYDEKVTWLTNKNNLPKLIKTIHDFEQTVTSLSQPFIAKPLWSSSGKGQIWGTKAEFPCLRKKVESVIKKQGGIMLEPLLNKVADLSFHFDIQQEGHVDYIGLSFFETSSTGRYQGSLLRCQALDGVEQEITTLIATILKKVLEQSPYAKHYVGSLGIDALAFKNTQGEIHIQPCLEINCRYTMGRVALSLTEKIHPKAKGRFEIVPATQPVHEDWKMKDGLLRHGTFILTPEIKEQRFRALLSMI